MVPAESDTAADADVVQRGEQPVAVGRGGGPAGQRVGQPVGERAGRPLQDEQPAAPEQVRQLAGPAGGRERLQTPVTISPASLSPAP